MRDALNPNHPVLQATEDHWHKFCALCLFLLPDGELEITADLVDRFNAEWGMDKVVVVDARNNRLFLRLVTGDEAKQLARQEGGLPC